MPEQPGTGGTAGASTSTTTVASGATTSQQNATVSTLMTGSVSLIADRDSQTCVERLHDLASLHNTTCKQITWRLLIFDLHCNAVPVSVYCRGACWLRLESYVHAHACTHVVFSMSSCCTMHRMRREAYLGKTPHPVLIACCWSCNLIDVGMHRAIHCGRADCPAAAATLHLTLAPKRQKKAIRWTEDTVDNENMGKKKSKSAHLAWPLVSPCLPTV